MYWILNEKMVKQKHMFDKYRNDPDTSFKWLVDNLTDRLLNEIEKAGMLPPPWWNIDYENNIEEFVENGSWEPEDE